MLKELLDAIGMQAVKAAGPQQIIDGDPITKRYLMPDGTVKEFTPAPTPRDHKAFSWESLAAFVIGNVDCQIPSDSTTHIWVSRDRVVALLDNGTRRDRVTFNLRPSSQLTTLIDLEKRQPMLKQPDIIRLLRITLHSGFTTESAVESLRRLDWTRVDKETGGISRTNSSIGRELSSKLAVPMDAPPIPETITLKIPIWENCPTDLPREVLCALEIIPAEAAFKLIPMPRAIEAAISSAEEWLQNGIAEAVGESAKVFYGQP